MNLSVKNLKIGNIWRSYGQDCSVLFLLTYSVVRRRITTGKSGILRYCGQGLPSQLLLSSCYLFTVSLLFYCRPTTRIRIKRHRTYDGERSRKQIAKIATLDVLFVTDKHFIRRWGQRFALRHSAVPYA